MFKYYLIDLMEFDMWRLVLFYAVCLLHNEMKIVAFEFESLFYFIKFIETIMLTCIDYKGKHF